MRVVSPEGSAGGPRWHRGIESYEITKLSAAATRTTVAPVKSSRTLAWSHASSLHCSRPQAALHGVLFEHVDEPVLDGHDAVPLGLVDPLAGLPVALPVRAPARAGLRLIAVRAAGRRHVPLRRTQGRPDAFSGWVGAVPRTPGRLRSRSGRDR